MNLSILLFGTLVLSISFDGTIAQIQNRFQGQECTDEFCQGASSIGEVGEYCQANRFETAAIVGFCRDRQQFGQYSFKCCRRTVLNNQFDNEIDDNPSARWKHFTQFSRTSQPFPIFTQPQQQQFSNNFRPTQQRQKFFARNRAIPQQSFQPQFISPQFQFSQRQPQFQRFNQNFNRQVPTSTFGKK